MEPKKVGRALGIGVRVASKMVQERMAAAPGIQPSENTAPATQFAPKSAPAAAPRVVSVPSSARQGRQQRVSAAKRGLTAFWQAFLGPFTHAGSILWLEITGLFFGLFAFFFVQNVYRARAAWRGGPDHLHWLLYVVLAAAFAWFSLSSFLRAHRKSRRGRVNR